MSCMIKVKNGNMRVKRLRKAVFAGQAGPTGVGDRGQRGGGAARDAGGAAAGVQLAVSGRRPLAARPRGDAPGGGQVGLRRK
jgi:hypothetical protein